MKRKKKPKKVTRKKLADKSLLRRKIIRIILRVCIVLLFLLIFLVFVGLGGLKKPQEPELFRIKDECSLVMGNLIHSIKDEGECKLRCFNDCGIRRMEYDLSKFREVTNSCNSCDCYCR